MASFYCGVEGGATNTVLVVLNAEGRIVGRAAGSGSNQYLIGIPAVAELLVSLASTALAAAGLPPRPASPDACAFASLGACMSGFLERAPQEELVRLLRETHPWLAREYYIDNDSAGSVYTAAGGAGGCVLIAGTGSMGQLITSDGRTINCGGHGHAYGDEGSAYSIASGGIRHIVAEEDGFDPLDAQFYSAAAAALSPAAAAALTRGEFDTDAGVPPPPAAAARKAMHAHFGISSSAGMLEHMYGAGFHKDRVAAFAAVLAGLAQGGDAFSAWLFARAGRELGSMARTLAKGLVGGGGGAVRGLTIVCVGSVWRSWPLLRRAFIRAATAPTPTGSRLETFRLVRLLETSAVGAAWRAAQLGPHIELPLAKDLTEEIFDSESKS